MCQYSVSEWRWKATHRGEGSDSEEGPIRADGFVVGAWVPKPVAVYTYPKVDGECAWDRSGGRREQAERASKRASRRSERGGRASARGEQISSQALKKLRYVLCEAGRDRGGGVAKGKEEEGCGSA